MARNNESFRSLVEFEKAVLFDKNIRRAITTSSHWAFFHIFFSEYVRYPTALFQHEMLELSEKRFKLLVVMAFRGSGKTTILNLSYPLWAILGVKQKKCVVIISRTRDLVAAHMRNIKHELEHNELLRDDLGPFREDPSNWGTLSLELPYLGARIIGVSREQRIRGLLHGKHRPDLIICDDLDDTYSVKTPEERDATYDWFKSEVVPIGDRNTEIILLGNLLHEDSLLMRLRDQIKAKEIEGVFRAYPLTDDNNKPLWPGKFPTKREVEKLRAEIADETVWKQEYLLVLPYDSSYDNEPDRIKLRRQFLKIIEAWRRKSGRRLYSPLLRGRGFRISAPYGHEIDHLGEWLLDEQRKEERRIHEMRDKSKDPPRLRPPGYEPPVDDDLSTSGRKYIDKDHPLQKFWDEVARKALFEQRANENREPEFLSSPYDPGPDNFDPYD